jgi:hypothetical protein
MPQPLTAEQRADKSRYQKLRRAAERQGFKLVAVRTPDGGIPRDPRAPLAGLWELHRDGIVVLRGKITDVEWYLFQRPIGD